VNDDYADRWIYQGAGSLPDFKVPFFRRRKTNGGRNIVLRSPNKWVLYMLVHAE